MPFYSKEGENYTKITKERKIKNPSRRIVAIVVPIENPNGEIVVVKLRNNQGRTVESDIDFNMHTVSIKEPGFDWKGYEIIESTFFIKNWDIKKIEAAVIYSKEPIE